MFPDPPAGVIQGVTVVYGGMVLRFGSTSGDLLDDVDIASSSKPTLPWKRISGLNPSGMPSRFSARIQLFGNILYRFGGCDAGLGAACHNDLWAIDLQDVITNGFQSQAIIGWFNVIPDNQPGMPSPRRSFSMHTYSHSIYIFGGSNNNGGQQPTYLSDVWQFKPGNPLVTGPGGVSPANFVQLSPTGGEAANGNAIPIGRASAATGMYADLFHVFGGVGAAGQLTDFWVLNVETQTWYQIGQTSPWPMPAPATGMAATFLNGRNFYVFLNNGNQNQLWNWAFVPTGAPSNNVVNNGTSTAAYAGIVFSVLFGLVNLAIAVILLRRSGGIRGASAESVGNVYNQLDGQLQL
jgi:Kelch motif